MRMVRCVLVPLLAAALLGWWAVGDLSEPGGTDQMFRLRFAQDNAGLIGVAGALISALGLIALVGLARDGPRRSLAVAVGAAVCAGAFVAFALRLVTAHTAGANIGGGGIILFGWPIVLALLIVAVRAALRLPVTSDASR
jgi:hypothetical protein